GCHAGRGRGVLGADSRLHPGKKNHAYIAVFHGPRRPCAARRVRQRHRSGLAAGGGDDRRRGDAPAHHPSRFGEARRGLRRDGHHLWQRQLHPRGRCGGQRARPRGRDHPVRPREPRRHLHGRPARVSPHRVPPLRRGRRGDRPRERPLRLAAGALRDAHHGSAL
ncbi:MAG: hypothetical protein AVDCRST_MAG68-1878, partial [uncultured Gemmatimonadetes bacterium]